MTKRQRLIARLKDGWNEIPLRDAVLETELSKDEKLVLLALISHADEKRVAGAERGVSVRRVAELASLNKDSPSRILVKLEAAGFVRVLRDPRARHADSFDLSELPTALVRALSDQEGQALSDGRGQKPTDTITGCPSPAVPAVPPQQPSLSDGKGTKEPLKEPLKEPTTPRRSAAGSEQGFALAAPKPPKAKQPKPEKAKDNATPKAKARKRSDTEVASHREILDGYSAAVPAAQIGSREAGAAWRLLDWARGDGARAIGIVRSAVGREFGGTTSLVVIAADPNKFLAAPLGRTAKARPQQADATAAELDAIEAKAMPRRAAP